MTTTNVLLCVTMPEFVGVQVYRSCEVPLWRPPCAEFLPFPLNRMNAKLSPEQKKDDGNFAGFF